MNDNFFISIYSDILRQSSSRMRDVTLHNSKCSSPDCLNKCEEEVRANEIWLIHYTYVISGIVKGLEKIVQL